MLYSTLDFNKFRKLSMFTVEKEYGGDFIFFSGKKNATYKILGKL